MADVSPWPPVSMVVDGVTPPPATLFAEVLARTAPTSGVVANCGGGGGGGGGVGLGGEPAHIYSPSLFRFKLNKVYSVLIRSSVRTDISCSISDDIFDGRPACLELLCDCLKAYSLIS